jgi:hypothetical protein
LQSIDLSAGGVNCDNPREAPLEAIMFSKKILSGRLWSIAAFALFATYSEPSLADCTFASLCLDKTEKNDTNMQAIIANRKAVLYKTNEVANFNYADIKIQCSSSGLESFARQFVDRAWNIGLITASREFALTVDIEQISKNTAAPPRPITYLIAQVKRDAAGNTTVTGCDDFLATNIAFNSALRMKFKLLQSKTTTVNAATYSAIRIVSKVLGFIFAGPGGAAVVSSATDISGAIVANKSDIDEIVKAFDEVDTQKPQATFDTIEKSVTLSLSDGSQFTIARIGKRSAFLTFDGNKLNAAGAPIQGPIANSTGIDLSSYLTTKAGNWETLIASSDPNTAKAGCSKIREALGYIFTNEEMVVILAKQFNQFSDLTIKELKDPCLKAIEREALKTMGVPDPLGARLPDPAPTDTPRNPANDAQDRIRWSSIKEFLNEFGHTLSVLATSPNLTKEAKAKKLAPYFDTRVATESFDAPELLPTSAGVLKDSIAEKLSSWPMGNAIRYGCFLVPDKTLSTKYSAQMLLLLDSGGGAQRIVNLIFGFTDPKATEVDSLIIGNLLAEKPTAASLSTFSNAYKSGCGDRSDPWKPWDTQSLTLIIQKTSRLTL